MLLRVRLDEKVAVLWRVRVQLRMWVDQSGLTSKTSSLPALVSVGLAIRFPVFDVVEVQHHVCLSAKVPLEPVQRHANDIAVMNFSATGNIADLNPKFMNKVDVVFGEMRRVRTEIKDVLVAVGLSHLESDLAARFFRQTLPRAAKFARLFLRGHL